MAMPPTESTPAASAGINCFHSMRLPTADTVLLARLRRPFGVKFVEHLSSAGLLTRIISPSTTPGRSKRNGLQHCSKIIRDGSCRFEGTRAFAFGWMARHRARDRRAWPVRLLPRLAGGPYKRLSRYSRIAGSWAHSNRPVLSQRRPASLDCLSFRWICLLRSRVRSRGYTNHLECQPKRETDSETTWRNISDLRVQLGHPYRRARPL